MNPVVVQHIMLCIRTNTSMSLRDAYGNLKGRCCVRPEVGGHILSLATYTLAPLLLVLLEAIPKPRKHAHLISMNPGLALPCITKQTQGFLAGLLAS